MLITAHGNESLAAGALRLGADDYLAKDQSMLEMLPEILERVPRSRELRKALVAAERDLVRAERLAAIGEMTVALHHEINNPLKPASTDVELLLADPDLARSSGGRPWKGCARRCSAFATSSGRSATSDHRHTKSTRPACGSWSVKHKNSTPTPPPRREGALVKVGEEGRRPPRHYSSCAMPVSAVERCATTEDLRLAPPQG